MMFGRKNKQPVEQGRGRRSPDGERQQAPAFSYYSSTNARTDSAQRRPASRVDTAAPIKQGSRRLRLPIAQVPFWLLLIVIIACAVKLLALSTNPKVIVLGQSGVANTYVQSTDVYAVAAQRFLASSLANHTKLTANVSGTGQTLQKQFPELQTASLTVPLIGNRPLLYVQIAPPSVVLETAHGNYAVNDSGIVLSKLTNVPAQVPILTDQTSAVPKVGQQFLPGSTIHFIQTVNYQLVATKLTPAAFDLPLDKPYELDMHLEGKTYIVKFSLASDALQQSGTVVATLDQLGDAAPTSYLDARVPERMYYK